MKKIVSKKTITVALVALFSFSAITHAQSSNCSPQERVETYTDPFMTLDLSKSIDKLPKNVRNQASIIVTELYEIEENSEEESLSEMDENRMDVLEIRLDRMFEAANVDYVEVDLLTRMSNADQLKALKLWRKIGNSEDDDVVEQTMNDLDELLMSAEES